MGHRSSKPTQENGPHALKCLHVDEIERRLAEKVWLIIKPQVEAGFVFDESRDDKATVVTVTGIHIIGPRMRANIKTFINTNYLRDSGLKLDHLDVHKVIRTIDDKPVWRLAFAVIRKPAGEAKERPPAYSLETKALAHTCA